MKFANVLWLVVLGLTILTYCTASKDCGFIELCIVTFVIIMFKDYREQPKNLEKQFKDSLEDLKKGRYRRVA